MAYGIIRRCFAKIRRGDAQISEDYNVVMQTGGANTWHYEGIEDGKVQRFEVTDDELVEIENLGCISMCATNNFTDFLKFGKENYPAEDYALIDYTEVINNMQMENEEATYYLEQICNSYVKDTDAMDTTASLAVYAPYNYGVHHYNQGRKLFLDLNYDKDIISFYDAVVSLCLANEAYIYDWYEESMLNAYGNPTTEAVKVCSAELTEKDGYYAWDVNENLVVSTYTWLNILDGDMLYVLGRDEYADWDADGDLMLTKPQTWMLVNDTIAFYYGTAIYTVSEADSIYACEGIIYAYVNDSLASIFTETVWTNGYRETSILGYQYMDENLYDIPGIYELTSEDTVELLYMIYDISTDEMTFEKVSAPLTKDEMIVDFGDVDLSEYDCWIQLSVEDIYGEEHKSESAQAY